MLLCACLPLHGTDDRTEDEADCFADVLSLLLLLLSRFSRVRLCATP